MPPCVNVRGGSLTYLIVNVRSPFVNAPPCVNVRGGSLTYLIVHVRSPLVNEPRRVDERLRHVDEPPSLTRLSRASCLGWAHLV